MTRRLIAALLLGAQLFAAPVLADGIAISPPSLPLAAANGGTGNANGFIKGSQGVLGTLRGANFNSTADQAIAINANVTSWAPTAIWVTNCSGTMTLAAGGFYTGASKSGTTMVSAAQAYSALTTTSLILVTTMAGGVATAKLAVATIYLSLTTAAGSAATCDVYVIGVDLT